MKNINKIWNNLTSRLNVFKRTTLPISASKGIEDIPQETKREFAVIYDWAPTFDPKVANVIEQAKAQSYILVYQNIDPNVAKTGEIDPEIVIQDIEKRYGKNPNGWGMLDFEFPFDEVLISGPTHPQYSLCVKSMVNAIRIVKAKFPNVKWTYYGLPSLSYWPGGKLWAFAPAKNQQEEIEKQLTGYGPVMHELDWYSPCVYDVYKIEAFEERFQKEHIENERIYRIARINVVREFFNRNKLKPRPILPAVCPFFVGGGNAIDNELIPQEELIRDQIMPIIEAKCDGMAIWTAGNWYLQQATLPTNPNNKTQERVRKLFKRDFLDNVEPASWTSEETKALLARRIGSAIADMAYLAYSNASNSANNA